MSDNTMSKHDHAGATNPAAIPATEAAENQIPRNFELSETATATSGAAATPVAASDAETPKPAAHARTRRRASGSGAMGPRLPDDLPGPQREAMQRAAADARATGHRFDLMRYLRLRRPTT
jgi:hypothetical protein